MDGIFLDHYPNDSTLAFDLTSLQEGSHDFNHPEIANCSKLVQITFDGLQEEYAEILILLTTFTAPVEFRKTFY